MLTFARLLTVLWFLALSLPYVQANEAEATDPVVLRIDPLVQDGKLEINADVRFDDDLALDVVIGHTVRVGWQHTHPSMELNEYPKHKAHAWGQFYLASPGDCRRWQMIALRELAEQNRLV